MSSGIGQLFDKGFISIENKEGKRLYTIEQRRGRFRKFYRCLLFETKKAVKFTPIKEEILRTTKLTDTKLNKLHLQNTNKGIRKLTDLERYYQIIGRSVK